MNKVLIKRIIRKIRREIYAPIRFKTGIDVYRKLKTNKRSDSATVVLTHLIGDSIYGLSCIENIKKKYGFVYVIGNEKYKDIFDSYGCIDELILINDKSEYDKIECFLNSPFLSRRAKKYKIFNTNPCIYPELLYGCKEDAISLIARRILGFDYEGVSYHKLGEIKVEAIKGFYDNCHRIVVINPYSTSVSFVDMELYKGICKLLSIRGFYVYTNVVGNQKAIDGSMELRCSITELYSIARHISLVVSVRSGILDLLAASGVGMFVIYENCNKNFQNMYRLSGWKTISRLREINADQLDKTAILKELETFIIEGKGNT